ncbi:hypothetical protein R3I94_016827 [Phoxinus phoxinus]
MNGRVSGVPSLRSVAVHGLPLAWSSSMKTHCMLLSATMHSTALGTSSD